MRDTLLAFGIATVGTLVGTVRRRKNHKGTLAKDYCSRNLVLICRLQVCAWLAVLRLVTDAGAWKVAASLCASYIGGTVNFVATGQALQLAPSLAAGALVCYYVQRCLFCSYVAQGCGVDNRWSCVGFGQHRDGHLHGWFDVRTSQIIFLTR